MFKQISFWLAVVAVIAYAIGTLPTIHGMVCFLFGTACVVALRFVAREEGVHLQVKRYIQIQDEMRKRRVNSDKGPE